VNSDEKQSASHAHETDDEVSPKNKVTTSVHTSERNKEMGLSKASSMGINTHVANALRPPSTESGLKRVQVVPSGLRPTVSMPSSAQNFRKS